MIGDVFDLNYYVNAATFFFLKYREFEEDWVCREN